MWDHLILLSIWHYLFLWLLNPFEYLANAYAHCNVEPFDSLANLGLYDSLANLGPFECDQKEEEDA